MTGIASALVGTSSVIWVDPLVILGIVATIMGVLTPLVLRPLYLRIRGHRSRREQFQTEWSGFMRDWQGEPERPGVPARPGVMLRLQTHENDLTALAGQVEVIHSEVNYNHGGSIKDAVGRIESDIKGIHMRLDAKEG